MGRKISNSKSVQKVNGGSVRKLRTLRRFTKSGTESKVGEGRQTKEGSKVRTLKRFPLPPPVKRSESFTLSSIYDSPAAMTRQQYMELRNRDEPEFVKDHQVRVTGV